MSPEISLYVAGFTLIISIVAAIISARLSATNATTERLNKDVEVARLENRITVLDERIDRMQAKRDEQQNVIDRLQDRIDLHERRERVFVRLIVSASPTLDVEAELRRAGVSVVPMDANPQSMKEKMIEMFSLEELRTVAQDAGIDPDEVIGVDKSSYATNLISKAARLKRSQWLVDALRVARPEGNF